MKPDTPIGERKLIELAPVVGLTILAGAFRFYALGHAPPGLYHDEAFNGLDALGVLAGDRPIYFPANNGREPMYIYLVAVAVGLLGPSPLAVRLPAAIAGTLTIPATYWMVHQLWGRRAGLLAAAIMAITLWPVHLSRTGFRAVLLPLFVALGIGLATRAWRSGGRRDWVVAGAAWGLASYTYLAVRFAPVVFLLVVLFLLVFRRIEAGPFLLPRLSNGAVWATVGFALAVAPLAIYTLGNWDVVMGRPGGVSIFEPGINRGDLPGALVNNTLKAFGMFVWQGDRIPRHNVPYRPVFDLPMAAAFVAGLVVIVRQARYRIAAMFVLIWLGVMLMPTILAEDTPHFLRAAGVLPVAAVFPALGLAPDSINRGLDWLEEKIRHTSSETQGNRLITSNSRFQTRRLRACVSLWLIIGVLGVSAFLTLRDYAAYAASAEAGYAFESGAVELAEEIDRLGESGYIILMDDVFPQEWTSMSFLLDTPPDALLAPGADLAAQPGTPALIVSWPYDEWLPRLDAWPAPVQIQVKAGPLVKGDRDPQPYPMAVLALVEPSGASGGAAQATFEGGSRLLGHAIEDRGDVWLLRTLWQTDRAVSGDVTQFVHLLDGGALVATVDGDPGDGLYPMRLWRAGDVIVDERPIPLPASRRSQLSVAIGLYDRRSGARLKVVEANSPVAEDALQLRAPGGPGP